MNAMIKKAVELIKSSKSSAIFSGAGISEESGIPTFRGKNGIWEKYDPNIFELEYFYKNPKECWYYLKEIFYNNFDKYSPNMAHKIIAEMQKKNLIHYIITQNIDYLHQKAGSINVIEFHGTLGSFICVGCRKQFYFNEVINDIYSSDLPLCPICKNENLNSSNKNFLKPNIVFFGENIPPKVIKESFEIVEKIDLMIIIGTTGQVYPAASLPYQAKSFGAKIIEINLNKSEFTNKITDIYLEGKAGEVMQLIFENL